MNEERTDNKYFYKVSKAYRYISFNVQFYLCSQAALTEMLQIVKFLPKRFSLKCSIRGNILYVFLERAAVDQRNEK